MVKPQDRDEKVLCFDNSEGLLCDAALNALPDDAYLSLRKTGALPLAYALLFSMNQLAMLPKAVRMQAQIKGQLAAKATGQALSQALSQATSQAQSQAQSVSDMDFLFPPGDTMKFSWGAWIAAPD